MIGTLTTIISTSCCRRLYALSASRVKSGISGILSRRAAKSTESKLSGGKFGSGRNR